MDEIKFNFSEKCGCGKDGRYFNREGGSSCNKYMRCPTYEELSETAKQRYSVIMHGLSLIKLSEQFDINLGKGWRDFKEQAEAIGIVFKTREETQAETQEMFSRSEIKNQTK